MMFLLEGLIHTLMVMEMIDVFHIQWVKIHTESCQSFALFWRLTAFYFG